MPHRLTSPPRSRADFDRLIAARAIRCVYQPIVALDTREVIGYEALARGPTNTVWSRPDALVSYATRVDRLPELDWICRAAACRGALEARLPQHMPLFVNIEPVSSRSTCPPDLAGTVELAAKRFDLVAEVTERSVANDPAGLLTVIDDLRCNSWRIAIDDVGVNPASQALMPLFRPDIIKIDRTVVHATGTSYAAQVADAVRTQAQQTGAAVLAEGVESEQQLRFAASLGATFGQGWLFGRPVGLPRLVHPPRTALPRLRTPSTTAGTPFNAAAAGESFPATTLTLRSLIRTVIENGATDAGPRMLLAAAGGLGWVDADIARACSGQVAAGAFTAVFARDLPDIAAPDVRFCRVPPDDPLADECAVIAVGSGYARGVFARPSHDRDECYDSVCSGDLDTLLRAARTLIARVPPARDCVVPYGAGTVGDPADSR